MIKMRSLLFSILSFLAFTVTSSAQQESAFFEGANRFFKMYVTQGKVDYTQLKDKPAALNSLLELAANIQISPSDAKQYQAFWINAYNLAVIKGIVKNMPLKSPLDKKGFFDKDTYLLGKKKITLNDIEHKLLRPVFKDPRVHFVLVCGAIGCPPLISEAYMPNTLDAQLQKQTELAINGSYFIKIKKKKIEVSEIMKWYREDFTKNGTSEIDFINQYRKEKLTGNYKIAYFPYNWNINILK